MENPSSWGKVEWIIYHAWEDWTGGQEQGLVGWSLFMQIAHALRQEGLLKEEE